MNPWTRRQFLSRSGAVSLAGLFPWRGWKVPGRVSERDLLSLSDFLIENDRDAVLARIAAFAGQGWTRDELLGAIFLAGLREVNPDPCGFKFHCVMVSHSAALLADTAPAAEALLPVLFNASDFKHSQERDRREGDFRLVAAPEPQAGTLDELVDALRLGLEDWSADACDRAATGAARHVTEATVLDRLFDGLWVHGMRDFHNLGHKIIFVAQTYRMLRRLPRPALAEPALRSLCKALLIGGGEEARIGSPQSHALAREPKKAWRGDAASDPEHAIEVLRILRSVKQGEGGAAIAELLEDGASPAAVWDGYRLFAAEQHLHAPGLLAVHPLTTINASRFAAERALDPVKRRFLLLQTAEWQVAYRRSFTDGKPAGLAIDALEPGDAIGAERLLETKSRLEAVPQALRVAKHPRGARSLMSALSSRVRRKGDEHHYHKYIAAVDEERGLMHPALAPHLLAASVCYVPGPSARDTDFARH